MDEARVLLAVAAVFGLWALYTVAGALALQAKTAHRTAVAPFIHWTERPPPCFWSDTPDVWDETACGSNALHAKWTLYCEPDPDCLELPDGTSYASAPRAESDGTR